MMLELRFFVVMVFLGIGGCSLLNAQYQPTAVEGANWVLINSEINFPYRAYILRIEGDTLVGEYAYKKLYRYTIDYIEVQTSPPLEPPYDLLPDRELIALLRDDMGTRSVFGRVPMNQLDSEFSTDTLIHDYSLEVADTLLGIFFGTEDIALPITETGVENRYGIERRCQKAYNLTFCEGIGSSEFGPVSGGSSLILNMYEYKLMDHCVGDFPECGLIISSLNELSESVSLTLHPNPVPATLNVQLSSPLPSEVAVTLYDLNGRTLRQAELRDNLSWELADLPSGVYVAVFTHEGARVVRKVVKE